MNRPPPSKQLSETTAPLRASSSTDRGPADQAQLHLENTAYRDHISAVEAALSTRRESSVNPLGMGLLKATSDLQPTADVDEADAGVEQPPGGPNTILTDNVVTGPEEDDNQHASADQ